MRYVLGVARNRVDGLMSLKLVVKNVADPTYSNEFVFVQDRITIGRDPSNLLALPDDKRILSKQHAEIHVSDGGAEVVDLGSKNYTYLNDERLPSREPRDVRHGDVLRMGDFEVQVVMMEPDEPASSTAPSDDRTVFAFNPFWEPAEQFRKVIQEVQRAYKKEPPGRRREALREAVVDALGDDLEDEVLGALATALGGSSAAPSPEPSPAAPSPPTCATSSGRPATAPARPTPACGTSSSVASSPRAAGSSRRSSPTGSG